MPGRADCPADHLVQIRYQLLTIFHRKAQGLTEATPQPNLDRRPRCLLGGYRNVAAPLVQIYPYEIVGRRLRIKTDGTQIHKVHLKEEDRKTLEHKLEVLAMLYKKMTNKNLSFEFVKTLAEEKRKKKKKAKEGKAEEGKKAQTYNRGSLITSQLQTNQRIDCRAQHQPIH
eukprot:TRINITY_DN135078_c0_g1_i1.p5 TRINITY_DN135078_c0_g1~~TRINITY_DN135078_c0_g1_i1.p5  ORF type:complete len:171 (-),score=6.22 TRINITY_DN135078_c0_g1_i1:73-585(-)